MSDWIGSLLGWAAIVIVFGGMAVVPFFACK